MARINTKGAHPPFPLFKFGILTMADDVRLSWGILDLFELSLVGGLLLVPAFYIPGWHLPWKSGLFVFHLIQIGLNSIAFHSTGYWITITLFWDLIFLGTQYVLYTGYLPYTWYGFDEATDNNFKEFTKLGILAGCVIASLLRGLNLFTRNDMLRREAIDRERYQLRSQQGHSHTPGVVRRKVVKQAAPIPMMQSMAPQQPQIIVIPSQGGYPYYPPPPPPGPPPNPRMYSY